MIDTVALLLADRSPALRYRTLTEVDGASPDDPEVIALRDQLANTAEATRAMQEKTGSKQLARSGGAADLSYKLCRLAFAGLRKGNAALDSIAERIFSSQRRDGSWPDVGPGGADSGSSWSSEGGYEWHPLQTALPLRGLAAAGYATDERSERAYAWIIEKRHDDGTWPYGKGVFGAPPGPVMQGYRRIAGSGGCRATTTGVLACLAHHPERRTSTEARSAIDVLLRRESREEMTLGHEVSRLLGFEPVRGFATFYATHDLAFLLDIATRVGVSTEDDRVKELAGFLQSKRTEYGLWEHPRHPHLSRWLTLDILASLRRLESGDWMGSEYRLPFTAYPKKRRRY